MLKLFYDLLAGIGYSHPIHPTQVHLPIGLVAAALIFAIVAAVSRNKSLERTARHCIILALIWMVPAAVLGYTDWRHYYAGAWIFPIKAKFALAAILAVLLLVAIFVGRAWGAASRAALAAYVLCFIVVGALAYYGAELVYANKPADRAADYAAGEKIYTAKCAACHPGGANILMPGLPVLGSPKLASRDVFSAYVRNPLLSNGKTGAMPALSVSVATDAQTGELYDYIVHVLDKKTRP